MRLFARGGDVRTGDFARGAGDIRRFAQANRDRNVYVAPNPTNQTNGIRHAAKDVTHWSYFLVDMDPVMEKCDPLAALTEALLWLGEWAGRDFQDGRSGLPIIIDSGRGMQAWIRLEDVELDDAVVGNDIVTGAVTRKVARRVNGHWLKKLDSRLGVVYGCKIDTSVSDLPRVMRCPGTFNAKTGRPTQFIHTTDRVFKGLAQLLVNGTPTRVLEDHEPPATVQKGLPWTAVYKHLTLSAQEYLVKGKAEPGRHKVMWHTARKLQELGVTRAEARRALKWANALAGEDEELPADQITHALDTAYGS